MPTRTTKICSAEGCTRRHYARGLCINHYAEQKRRARGIPTRKEFYRAARKFSPEQESAIRQAYEQGKTLRELAAQHDSNTATIADCVRRAGGTLRKTGAKRPENSPLRTFAPAKLRDVREKARLSQSELAAKIGCPKPDLIRQWEKGERTPSATYLLKILIACSIPPSALLSAPPPACRGQKENRL